MRNLVFIVYDSILNSVFDGQVLRPLLNRLQNKECDNIYLISFEKKLIFEKKLCDLNNLHKNLHVIILTRRSFFISWLLFPEIRKLKKILSSIDFYEIIARGPLAGFIAQRALNNKRCSHLTVQARGLLAEEYKYEHRCSRGFRKYLHLWRMRQYLGIERAVYNKIQKFDRSVIEIVSKAMGDFLIENYDADGKCFTYAEKDIPFKIAPACVAQWRSNMRKHLKIPDDAKVFCFSGAIKAWQCPDLVISYFSGIYKKNNKAFLLILTFDIDQFRDKLQKVLPPDSYLVLCVAHEKIYEFLAVADFGIVFREKNVVSWVSRPVKAMEYQAVDLKIIHNSAVEWLISLWPNNDQSVIVI